jgi:hypothetical protein
MKRTILSIAAIGAISGLISCAARPVATVAARPAEPGTDRIFTSTDDARETAPATQPTIENAPVLPKGHPDISAMTSAEPGAANPALPKGHPDISAMRKNPQLPAGHPDISKMQPSTQPAGFTTLTVRAVQGTIGGPGVKDDSVRIEVLSQDHVAAKIETKLSETGEVSIGGLPVGPGFQPVVTVTHAGVEYRVIGEPVTASPQNLDVTVYETTDKPVGWEVRMRHVMLQPTEAGVQVIDMLAIDNATDRAYVGTPGSDGKPVTFELPLPANATDVQLSGAFHDCCTQIVGGKIINTMAIVPGNTQYQISYLVPMTGGKAEIATSAPAVTKQLIIFAPDDGTSIEAAGLESGISDMGQKKVRYFKGSALPAGSNVKLTISGTPTRLTSSQPRATGAAAGLDSAQLAKAVAGAGGLLILLVGGATLLKKNARKA